MDDKQEVNIGILIQAAEEENTQSLRSEIDLKPEGEYLDTMAAGANLSVISND
jgi:hypothetical protein